MWNELTIPIVIAHRGDAAFAPENTLPAFQQAADKGAEGIEFDVKLSADGEVIVIHNQTVDLTTNGSGNVAKMPLADLRRLDAGVLFPGKFPAVTIPTLDEVFETFGRRLFMNIELKNYNTPADDLVARVAELVRRHGLQYRVFFSSFLHFELCRAQKLLPEVPCGQLAMRGWMGWWGRTFGWRGRMDALNPFHVDVTASLVDQVHAAGKRVIDRNDIHCWGAYALDTVGRRVDTFTAGVVMLSTGGLGHVYLHTTNPVIATGDGVAMAYRAGARTANMEFIQFHPTTLFDSGSPSYLISEAVRGFGGVLKARNGDEFMQMYDERKSLAPRDIVAYAIDTELKKRGDDFVLLDLRHLPAAELVEHFPNIYNFAVQFYASAIYRVYRRPFVLRNSHCLICFLRSRIRSS